VILHRITLRNVGVYGGEHIIDLTPPDAERPVVLIGALNGGGKTTLLGALQLALYGSRARGIERTRKGYQRYLRELIHRDASPTEGASVMLDYERRIEGKSVCYAVRRSWRVEDSELLEALTVHRNGEPDSLLAAHWDEAIDAYLPARLAHLFFFDGEQIERMADEEAASELLASAFQSLLGLDLVGRLQDDLSTLERRKKLLVRTPAERSMIEFMETEVQGAEIAVGNAKQQFAALHSSVERRQSELKKLKDKFKADGGELVMEREAFEAEHSRLTAERCAAEKRIREIAGGPAPLLLVTDLLQELRMQAAQEKVARRERIIAEAEEARDERILAELKAKLPANVCRTVADTLELHRPQREHLDTAMILNAEDDLVDEIDELLKRSLPGARSDLERLSMTWNALEEQIDGLDRKLATVPDADALARLQHEMVKMEAEILDGDSKRKEFDEQIRQAEFDLRIRQSALRKEMEKHADHWEDTEHDRRILERIPKIKDTLDLFRAKVVARHVGALEHAILTSFQHLARKPKLIGAISIDPASFAITLTDGEGRALPFNLLSAGERQLLATSILWGLAKVSGRPVPLVIDTPLGRLDSHHRSHVVQRYFPAASHQVVLLSTDEEIVGRYHEMIRPHVGRHLLIGLDPDDKRLTVSKSYFSN
jgi:DNA sulfur modification protein DndD